MSGMPEDLVAEAITEWWGERCPDYTPGCPCCDAWAQYDALRLKAGDLLRTTSEREAVRKAIKEGKEHG